MRAVRYWRLVEFGDQMQGSHTTLEHIRKKDGELIHAIEVQLTYVLENVEDVI
jgi:hypothetical protein